MNRSGFLCDFKQKNGLGLLKADPVIDHPGNRIGKETLQPTAVNHDGPETSNTTQSTTPVSVPHRNMWLLLGSGLVSILLIYTLFNNDKN